MKTAESKPTKDKKPLAKSSKIHSKNVETITSESQKSSPSVSLDPVHCEDLINEEIENSADDNNLMYFESSAETSNTLIHEEISKVRRTFDMEEYEDESGSEYLPGDDDDSEEECVKKREYKKKSKATNTSKSDETRPRRGEIESSRII